jgi:hypothetical protein
MRSMVSSGIVANGPAHPVPALQTRTSTAPARSASWKIGAIVATALAFFHQENQRACRPSAKITPRNRGVADKAQWRHKKTVSTMKLFPISSGKSVFADFYIPR